MTNFDKPRLKRRRSWWGGLALLALLALAYGGFWFMLALNSRQMAVQWIDEQRAHGFSVRYDSLEVTGFPLVVRLEFINPGFGAPNAALPWGWEGSHLNLLLKPWDMETIRARTSGPQMLAIPIKGKSETFNGAVSQLEASAKLSGGDPISAALMLEGVELNPETPGLAAIKVADAAVYAKRLALGKADHQTASASLDMSVQGLRGPWLASSPLGDTVQTLELAARQMGSFDNGPLVESLENWRDLGGTIEISKLTLQHGPLKVGADGTLALDDRLQPIGALTARVEGFFETIDALHALGMVTPRNAITAKMVLGVLSRKSGNGGPAHLNLALSAQGGRLYAGPIGLMELPAIDWRPFKK